MVRGITVENEVHIRAGELGYTFLDWSKEDQARFLYGLGDRLCELDEASGLTELFDFPEELMVKPALAELGERLNRALRAPLVKVKL